MSDWFSISTAVVALVLALVSGFTTISLARKVRNTVREREAGNGDVEEAQRRLARLREAEASYKELGEDVRRKAERTTQALSRP